MVKVSIHKVAYKQTTMQNVTKNEPPPPKKKKKKKNIKTVPIHKKTLDKSIETAPDISLLSIWLIIDIHLILHHRCP